MKSLRLIYAALFGALLLNSTASVAEDIDIYSGLPPTAANIPNVMLIVDNAANSNAQMGSCTYWDGTLPTADNTGNKSLDNYMCALDNIVHGMPLKADGTALVRIGITTQAGVILPLTPVDDHAYTGTFPGTAGKTNRQAIAIAIRSMTTVSGNANQGASFQETWAYYTGGNGGSTNVGEDSGTAYSGTNATTGCQKNYNIFISGVTSSAHSSTASSLTNLTNAVNNAVNTPVTSAGTTVATTLLTPVTYNLGSEKPYGIEWARFMYVADANSGVTGTQNIITYSIGAGSPVYPAAMGTWEQYIYDTSHYGGGKYFAATSYGDIYNDILKILNEIQSVNSVFASSSLPVSVNAQGTYLNQIYMGMFRPDANGLPRWVGNLKQYQFGYNQTTQTLSLVDSLGNSALSSAGTGFITPNAVSFWTTQDLSSQPDSGGGFWRNAPNGAGGGYDLPDGELVEKGGAAEVIRLANLYNNYTTNPSSPRNVYTYCPGGTSCNATLSNSANAFSTSNGAIQASMFGTSTAVGVSRVTRSIIGGVSTATATTVGTHGFSTGDQVTITNIVPPDYNGVFTITVPTGSTNTFTYPVTETPPSPATGSYQAQLHNAGISVNSITRSGSATSTSNTETVTVTTATPHGFVAGDQVDISGVTPSNYQGTYTISIPNTTACPAATCFTYPVTVTPPTTATGSYTVSYATTPTAITNASLSYGYVGGSIKAGIVTVTTSTPHGFVTGDLVTIAGVTQSQFNGTFNIKKIGSNQFLYVQCIGATACQSSWGGGVTSATATVMGTSTLAATTQTINSLTRIGTINSAPPYQNTATATISTANQFATGDVVTITPITAGALDGQYYSTGPYTITCTNTGCTTFTYPINTNPATPGTASNPPNPMSVAGHTTSASNITSLTRSYPGGTTVTAQLASGSFLNGDLVDINKQANTTPPAVENAYAAGPFAITCVGTSPCSTFTYTIVTGPAASTVGGTATKAGPPPKDPLINWVRGQDNYCDEASPGTNCPNQTTINIRPSVHGDVLHSRPTVINYGGTTGVVVFYGANDGVFRAVNGNQTGSIGTTHAGGELWSFIPTEFFGELQRMHDNSPVLLLSTTVPGIVPTPQKKNYFVDGSTSIYQKLNADGTTNTAYLYLSMRRGGNFLYALDVTTPSNPQFLWKLDKTNPDFAELGQTWSQPTVAFVKGYCGGVACSSSNPPTPVLIFGAGYDPAEDDDDLTTADSVGRGIFIVDALTGQMVWSATNTTGSDACANNTANTVNTGTQFKATCQLAAMEYSIPADITLIDRSGNDGLIDRLYASDTGGNIWRVDLEPTSTHTTPQYWQVTQLAALGCDPSISASGVCPSQTVGRKFFYPADMVPTNAFDAVLIGSGDREHPLSTSLSYGVLNRFFMVKDPNPGNDGTVASTPALPFTEADLEDITNTSTQTAICSGTDTGNTLSPTLTYDNLQSGYYFSLCTGEKVVNAPLTVAGYTYFGTNTPITTNDPNSCTGNLGVARGYRISPLSGVSHYVTYDGGGLPPSPVAGVVAVNVNGHDLNLPFCIGCGGNPDCVGADCKTPIGGGKPPIDVSTARKRTYWYKEKTD